MRPKICGLWRRAAGVLACATIAGCGVVGDGSISVVQFKTAERAAICRNEVLCEGYANQAACMATTASETQSQSYDTFIHDVQVGKVIYDEALARGCIDALNTLTSCTRSGSLNDPADSACSGIFTGTVGVGGTCFFSFECAPGASCAQDHCTQGQCCAGTCVAPSPALALGGDCTATGSGACPAGAACFYDPATGRDTCEPCGVPGAPCNIPNTCAAGLYCDRGSETCKPMAATREPCDPTSDSCDSVDDVCETSSPICTPRLALGSVCTPDEYNCIDYAACDAKTGTCVVEPTVGQPCDPTNGPPCLGSQCDPSSLTCTLPTPTLGVCS
jgi:hypothetical protein